MFLIPSCKFSPLASCTISQTLSSDQSFYMTPIHESISKTCFMFKVKVISTQIFQHLQECYFGAFTFRNLQASLIALSLSLTLRNSMLKTSLLPERASIRPYTDRLVFYHKYDFKDKNDGRRRIRIDYNSYLMLICSNLSQVMRHDIEMLHLKSSPSPANAFIHPLLAFVYPSNNKLP